MIRNRTIFCLLVFLFLIFSCKREEGKAEFEVQGLTRIDAKVYDTLVLNLHILQKGGESENAELSLRNVPKGLEYDFSKAEGKSSFETTFKLVVTDKIKLGTHSPVLVIKSSNSKREENFDLFVDDILSISFSVNDASAWTSDKPAGTPVQGAMIRLFADSASVRSNTSKYKSNTDSSGVACFYHLKPGIYYFTVTKGALSNIALRQEKGGVSKGFAIINLDRHGVPIYRDLDGDGKITDSDRVQTDLLILYENKLSEKIIWIR